MGFDEPTPIQARAIPSLLAERDVIAQALTGTGKTAAFGVPLVERVDPSSKVPQAIVLTPTRELAIQVTDHLSKIGHERRIAVLPIYGGQPIGRQLYALRRGVQVVVATPGRLLDHIRRETIELGSVRTLVLDEADQMLEMGFIDDVELILQQIPEGRVTALFSATMPKPIVDLASKHLRDPETIRLSTPEHLTAPEIDQAYVVVPFVRKMDALCRVLDVRQPERAIVFCATKKMVDEAVEGLTARGYQTEALHGDITQAQRERVLRAFRSGQVEVLVATDVAARGLDIPEVSHVINFDIPPDPEYYVHRIGRTGRFGRSGVAITFVNPREMRVLKLIERATGARIRREEVPTAAEAEEREVEILSERLLTALTKGGWGRYRPVIEELLDDHDPVDVAAAALGLVAVGATGTRRTVRAVIGPAQVGEAPRAGGVRYVGRERRAEHAPGEARAHRPAWDHRPRSDDVEVRDTVAREQPAGAMSADEAAEVVSAEASSPSAMRDHLTDAYAADDGPAAPARRGEAPRDARRRTDVAGPPAESRPRAVRRPIARGDDERSAGRGRGGDLGGERPRRAEHASRGGQGPAPSARGRNFDPSRGRPPERDDGRRGARDGDRTPSWDEIRATIDRGGSGEPESDRRAAPKRRGPRDDAGDAPGPARPGGTKRRDADAAGFGSAKPKGGAKAAKSSAGGPKAGGGFQLPTSKKGRKFVSLGGLKARRSSGPARGGRGR